MTVREKMEELKEKYGIEEGKIKLYADASGEELPLTNNNLDTEIGDCIVTGDTADLYI